MKFNKTAVTVVALTIISFAQGRASWLSEITGINIDINKGTITVAPPKPQAIPQMIQNLPKDVGQAMLNPVAPILAEGIRTSRAQALNRGTQPIPPQIKSALTPYFPPDILNKVTWTLTGPGITIDATLSNFYSEGAITYDDVVVFSNEQCASDIGLWAHELTHVMQYQNMGIDSFAFLYTYNWNSLESQARDNSSNIVQSIRSANSSSGQTYALSVQQGAFSQPLSWQQMNQQALKVIDPASCIWIANGYTGNSSDATIIVTQSIAQNIYGQRFLIPILGPRSVYPPHSQGVLVSPRGLQIVGVVAAFQQ